MGQVATSSSPIRRRPPQTARSAPRGRPRRPIHDEAAFLDSLARAARCEAERAVLELDALDARPKRLERTRLALIARRDRMLNEWEAAAEAAGHPYDDVMAGRVRHMTIAFRDRVRELRAAAGPKGRA